MVGAHEQADESAIRASWEAGDMGTAVAATLRLHGAEVFGFLVALHKDADEADDAFSLFAEHLWRTFPSFEWRCSVRTWSYLLARNASVGVRRKEARHARRAVPLAGLAEVDELAARIRTETLSVLRTEKQSAFQRMRDELPEEDRMLLVLRVDRRLPWRDVATVIVGAGDHVEDEVLSRQASRLRKRFQLVRERLQALGKERGLL